jgi:uncharacterized membrane protein YozB (DUF420 family)
MRRFLAQLPRRALLGALLLGSLVITANSLGYFDFETLPDFVIEKLPVRFEALWLLSLRIHVASAALGFPLCLLAMSRRLQRRPTVHRRLGKLAALLLLFALVPSGSVLAFDAKGGTPVTIGFLLSAAIVAAGVVLGVRAARRRDFVAHRRAMQHVVAQMSVAVSSRLLIVGLDALDFEPELAYVIALWVPVVLSALTAELATRRSVVRFPALVPCLERIRREAMAFATLVRLRAVRRPVPRLGR